ncbi:type 4a pilus biogenesis protein PilO [Candidatus Parcubacteria bacterium]|nr:type 4a pilus biogenesis protein PilO [Candidatus Parcubacteria bacterium]
MKREFIKPKYKPIVILITSFLMIVILVIVYFGVFGKIKQKTIESNKILSEIQNQNNSLENLRKQERLISAITNEKDKLFSLFIDKNSVARLFEELESVAEESGVDYSVVSAREGFKNNSGLTIQVAANGSFKGIYEFLLGLEDLPFGLNLKNVVIEARSEDFQGEAPDYPWGSLLELEIISYLQDK